MTARDQTPAERRPQAIPDDLPRIVSLEIHRVEYEDGLTRFNAGGEIRYSEAIEFLVETDREIPATAVTPCLLVGDVSVTDYVRNEDGRYTFYAYETDGLVDGAAISFGWPDGRAEPVVTGHRFRLDGRVG